jgi:type I restriction enzyme S subunit
VDLNTAEATETLGSLPPDWRSARIEEIASVGSGGTPSRKNPAYWGGTIPWVTTAQIDFGTIAEASECITEAGLRCSAARILAPGTLLLALYGQGKTRGKVAKLGISAATNQACASIAPGGQVDGDYLFHFLASRYQALRSASNAGSQENLSGRIVKDTLVALPPKAEQAAIATALSDVDTLLTKLDQLIAKKRDLKQAAMQQLLTGVVRLPGFADGWREMTIGDLADVKTGPFGSSLHESDYVDSGTPIITVEHLGERSITRQNLPMVSEADCRRLRAYSLQPGDVVFSRVGSIDRNALVTESESGWLFSGRLLRVRVRRDRADPSFLSHQFHSEPFKQRVREVAVGQTMPSLNTQILRRLPLALPTLVEQVAIAQVLSDMDTELAALEARREKTRQLKQGMMQALLTGRIRLV